MINWSEPFNPYSWTIKYWDDWRCIADELRQKARWRKGLDRINGYSGWCYIGDKK